MILPLSVSIIVGEALLAALVIAVRHPDVFRVLR